MSPDQTPAKVNQSMPKDGQDRKLKPPPPDHHVKCPRCDSPNTKFCYYNNYSLSQPRHFCKTCRRYWTKGGALRNVPIGGGCRKNKKMKQRLTGILNSRDSSSCEIMGSTGGGLNFFQGFLTPAMDFQLGSINPPPSANSSIFPGTDSNFTLYEHHHDTSQLNSGTGAVPTLMGFDYLRPPQNGSGREHETLQIGTSNNNSMIVHSNLASSIESLSSINQELHWRLQQQRLAVLFSGGDLSDKRDMDQVGEHQSVVDHHQQQPQSQMPKFQLQPILFQNLETEKELADPFSTTESRIEDHDAPRKSRQGENVGSATEWFFDVNPYSNGTNSNNNDDNNMMNNQTVDDNANQNHNWNTGIQAWSNMQQYDGGLP